MSDFPFSIPTTPPNRPTAFSQSDTIRQITITAGNPDDAANPGNQKGGAVTELSTSIVLTDVNQNVFINCRVVGELHINSANFGIILHRSGGTGGSVFLRAAEEDNRGRFISPNLISINGDDASTLDVSVITYVDTTTTAGTYIYTPVFVNTSGGSGVRQYMLNRVFVANNTVDYEVAVSTMVVQVI